MSIIIIVCKELPGNVEYSDGLNIGSVASYQCAHASGHQQIRCETTGWSGALCGNNNCSFGSSYHRNIIFNPKLWDSGDRESLVC